MKKRITSLHTKPKPVVPSRPGMWLIVEHAGDRYLGTGYHNHAEMLVLSNQHSLNSQYMTVLYSDKDLGPNWYSRLPSLWYQPVDISAYTFFVVFNDITCWFRSRGYADNFAKMIGSIVGVKGLTPPEPVRPPPPIIPPLFEERIAGADPEYTHMHVAGFLFFRRLIASNNVWYHGMGHIAGETFPYYVPFRDRHFRFRNENNARGFASAIGGGSVLTSRARIP